MIRKKTAKNIKRKLWKKVVSMGCVTYGIISGSYPMADFVVSCVVPWSFTIRNLFLRELLGWEMF